jgi:hydroxymethylglutaryl-CoA synthase
LGLQLGMALLTQNPEAKILLVASDVARYNLESAAESSQGAGAVAMLLTRSPRLLIVEPGSGFYTEDVMDFWRPNYLKAACVDGKYSCEIYLKFLEECWRQYSELTGRKFIDHQHFCYHIPLPKLVEKAHMRLMKVSDYKDSNPDELLEKVGISLQYSREIGNCYTASLYLGLASLLENSNVDLADHRIGFYSYGSGASGEYFSGKVVKGYRDHLFTKAHNDMLKNRQSLSYDEYINLYNFKLPEDGSSYTLPDYQAGKFKLVKIAEHKRFYE